MLDEIKKLMEEYSAMSAEVQPLIDLLETKKKELAALFGGDGIHGDEVHRVWLPAIETAPAYSSVGPVIIGGPHGAP